MTLQLLQCRLIGPTFPYLLVLPLFLFPCFVSITWYLAFLAADWSRTASTSPLNCFCVRSPFDLAQPQSLRQIFTIFFPSNAFMAFARSLHRRRHCLLRSAWVNVMPEWLLSVISGILAGEIPGFRSGSDPTSLCLV